MRYIILLISLITLSLCNNIGQKTDINKTSSNINIKKETNKKINNNNKSKKWKLEVLNMNVYTKTGGLEGKKTFYFNTKKEAEAKMKEILNNIKTTYQTLALVVSIFIIIIESLKINDLYKKLKELENENSIFKNDEEKTKLKNELKNEIKWGLFLVFLVNIFYLFLTYRYIENISFAITNNL